jgi:hypothetical protein
MGDHPLQPNHQHCLRTVFAPSLYRWRSGFTVSVVQQRKKHWLTIEFDDVADQLQGYVYARLDKKNYRRIMAALEAATGLEIEKILEE